jgi:hypothetical protein
VPKVGVQLARRERVELGAFGKGDVGDDQAMMVLGHVFMNGIREDSEVAVEEKDD